jgi:hypothetical protein
LASGYAAKKTRRDPRRGLVPENHFIIVE